MRTAGKALGFRPLSGAAAGGQIGAVELAGLAVAVGSGRGVKRSEEAGGTEEEMRCEREKF